MKREGADGRASVSTTRFLGAARTALIVSLFCLVLAACAAKTGSGNDANLAKSEANRSASRGEASLPEKERPEAVVWRPDGRYVHQDYETQALSELYGGALARSGFAVSYDHEFSEIVDVYPGYTPAQSSAETEPGYKPLRPAQDVLSTLTLVTTRELAERHGLEDTTDLALVPDVGVWDEPEYRESLEPFREHVGEVNPPDSGFSVPVGDDGNDDRFLLGYRALREGRTEAVLGFSTDPALADEDLVALTDKEDLVDGKRVGITDAYPAAFVRQEYLEAHPEAADALEAVSRNLTPDDLRKLNAAVLDDNPEALAVGVDGYFEKNPLPKK